jgi:hypothetical protein
MMNIFPSNSPQGALYVTLQRSFILHIKGISSGKTKCHKHKIRASEESAMLVLANNFTLGDKSHCRGKM